MWIRSSINARRVDTRAAASGELLTVKVRYKAPDGETSQLLSRVQMNRPSAMTANVGFASAVAEFGMLLRGSPSLGGASLESVTARARKFRGPDEEGYRGEFIRLAERAATCVNVNRRGNRDAERRGLLLKCGGKVEHHGERRRLAAIRRRHEEKPLPIRGDVPAQGVNGGGAANKRRGVPAWNPLLVSISTARISHVAAARIEQPLAVGLPTRKVAEAAHSRDESLRSPGIRGAVGRKRTNVDVTRGRFVRRVRDPAAIGRELRRRPRRSCVSKNR